MKRKKLLVALATAAGVSMSGAAGAATPNADSATFEAATAKGSTALQEVLSQNPDSALGNKALDQMIQLAGRGFENSGNPNASGGPNNQGARGFENSGNPNASGSPDNPGKGNPNTPDC